MNEVAQRHQSCCLEEVTTFTSLNDLIGRDCGYVTRKLPLNCAFAEMQALHSHGRCMTHSVCPPD